ncbi:MAG: hypothetical protein ACOYEB_03675 [Enterococcus lemanii]|jgi:hypothetical protein
MNRKLRGILLLALVGLSAINWRGAIAIVILILIYDKLFELEDLEIAEFEQEYIAAMEQARRQKEKDARFKAFMEDDWKGR